MSDTRTRSILILLVVVSLALPLSCMKKQMATWVGHSEAQLVQAWGAPDETYNLPDGSRTLTWITPMTQYNGVVTKCRQSFNMSPQGLVVSTSYSGC